MASMDDFPNTDIRVTEQFLREQEPLLVWLSVSAMRAALQAPGAVDSDVKEALEALIRTYRTLQSGLYYESRPNNTIAGAIYERIQGAVDEFRKAVVERSGIQTVRDVEVLGIVAFLQRLEIQHNNGRKLGRAFIDYLRSSFPADDRTQQSDASSLLV
jgi:hypothetical protein